MDTLKAGEEDEEKTSAEESPVGRSSGERERRESD